MKLSLVCMLLTLFQGQAQIVKGPTTQTVISGETAVFNCSMDCNNQPPVTWHFTLPTNSRTVFVSLYSNLTIIKTIYGIEVSRRTLNECPQGGYKVEQFFITSSRQLNLMPVQCSTLSDGGCGAKVYVSYSITALLNVPDVAPAITSATTPSSSPLAPSSSKSPSPSPSPSPSSFSSSSSPYSPLPLSLNYPNIGDRPVPVSLLYSIISHRVSTPTLATSSDEARPTPALSCH